jgi:hypothetical protein
VNEVVTINPEVRSLLNEFVQLYATFEQAAAAINVNRSTIAVYMQGARNIPAAQLKEIIRIVKRRVPPTRLTGLFDLGWEQRMLATAHEHNFLHQDNTAYRLNEELIRFLEYFAAHYPSRGRAAEALDVNPRTFKAYLQGSINSLPRSLFEGALVLLKDKGESDQGIADALAFPSLGSVLKPADRTVTSEMSATEIIDGLVDLWLAGGGSVRDQLRPIYNFCQRHHGSLLQAYIDLMPIYLAEYEERGQAAIADGRADEVLGLLDRISVSVRWFAGQISDSRRKATLPKGTDWKQTVRDHMGVHNRLRDLLFKEAPFSHQYMAKSEMEKLLFRYRHLNRVREYTPSTVYRPGDLIFHPMFGVGRVCKPTGRHKIMVRFTETEQDIILSVGT